MRILRRSFLALAVGSGLWLGGCASAPPPAEPAVRQALAPTGTLRVGVYAGSPSSMVVNPQTRETAGVAHDLGQVLATRLGVQAQVVEFSRVALVIDALKQGQIDFTFTNATEARAKDVDFTPPMVRLELGYLVPPDSTIASPNEVDRPGTRVGVTEGSSSQGVLSRQYQSAKLVPAASLRQAQQLLTERRIDVFATNKAILFELANDLPGYKVLEGRWGLENMAIAVPKGREAGMPFLREFASQTQSSGQLQAIVNRAGLRGTAGDKP